MSVMSSPLQGARSASRDRHAAYWCCIPIGVDRVIRFDTAARVAELAEVTEAASGRRTCLHVIDVFDVTADRISELLK
jgi:hypothetical protein